MASGSQPPSAAEQRTPIWSHRYVLGMRVDATDYEAASDQIVQWGREGRSRFVCVASVNNVIQSLDNAAFLEAMNASDLTTSDGMPLVWALHRLGLRQASRVYGPTLTPKVWEKAAVAGVPIGLFGGSPEVLERMIGDLKTTLPDLEIAYSYSPPFRPLSAAEDRAIAGDIERSGARIVFVGLGCPRQELWMHALSPDIPAVLVGVGAAFDFIAGEKKQAPKWIQDRGLEWLFRLSTEPRRLWRRYLYGNPRFMAKFLMQLSREKRSR